MTQIQHVETFVQMIWHCYLEDRAYDQLSQYFDESLSIIGTGDHEVSRSLKEFLEKLNLEAKQWTGAFVIEDEWFQTTMLSENVYLVIGELTGKEDANDLVIYDFHFRFSAVVKYENDNWKIIHLHQSVADINQGSDEFFPKRLIKQSNEQLRIKIAEKTRELQASNEAVLYYSHHDYLTNLTNRYYFEKKVNEYRKANIKGIYMILDIDDFKHYNDTYGHITGDEILKTLSSVMMKEFHDGETARIGGDEFSIFIPNEISELDLLDRLNHFYDSWIQEQDSLSLRSIAHVSIGIARYPKDGTTYALLMKHADEALYVCKDRQEHFQFYQAN